MIVADASAIIEALLRTPAGTRCADRLFADSQIVCAPHLMDIEVTQVIRRYVLRAEIDEERGRQAIDDLIDLPITRYSHEPFLRRVWELRNNLSAYDAVYLALSEALDAPLLTRDARIAKAHGHAAVVELIS